MKLEKKSIKKVLKNKAPENQVRLSKSVSNIMQTR
jgi:hypothetical protein